MFALQNYIKFTKCELLKNISYLCHESSFDKEGNY